MKYLKYIKELAIIITLVISLVSIRNSHSEIQNLKILLENTKNNLFQTNEIVAMMQKQIAEKR